MARQTNTEYWVQRLKNMEDALKDRSFSYVENMECQFMAAQAEVERQIVVWYQRFAANNEITLADAKRLLTSGELAEFRWTVGEYIAYGQQNATDGAWMRQLENASARVHITRLEALKLQIQQQAEALYANQLDLVDAAAREMYLGSYYGAAFEVQRGLGVGWTMQAINEATIAKVISRPWTVDGQTFRDRCWTNKQALVNSVNTQLTQMIIRGEAPDKAIATIAHQFQVSKGKAGRLIMTESAFFASAAQKDCYGELGVERYKIVASFDHDICELCGAMDGQVFKMSEYQPGLTAPPFHPWCRCCTAPYFEDMAGIGERWTRNPDGTTSRVPADMSFDEWSQEFVQGVQGSLTPPQAGDTILTSIPAPGQAQGPFTPAGTIEEAKEYALNTLGLPSATAYGLGVNLDVANGLNQAIFEINGTFGNLSKAGYLDDILIFTERRDAYAAYHRTLHSIFLNKVAKQKNALKKMAADALAEFNAGAWSSGNPMHSIYHELGHAVEHMICDNNPAVKNQVQILYAQRFSEILGSDAVWSVSDRAAVLRGCKNAQAAGFSYYGLRNEGEFVAESVAQYYGTDKPGEIARTVVECLLGGKT